MEWSILPPLPSWLRPLPSPPPAGSLQPLPTVVDYSQLKPLPALNGVPYKPLENDSLLLVTQTDESLFAARLDETQDPCRGPLEKLLMDLRRHNQIPERPDDSEVILVEDEATSEEEDETQHRPPAGKGSANRPEAHANINPVKPAAKTKHKRIRRQVYERRYALVSGSLMRYFTESKPGRVAYEARFAIRNGKWKRGMLSDIANASPSPLLPNSFGHPISEASSACQESSADPPKTLVNCHLSSDSRGLSPISRGSSPMSICTAISPTIVSLDSLPVLASPHSPKIPSSRIPRSIAQSYASSKLPSPPLTIISSPPPRVERKVWPLPPRPAPAPVRSIEREQQWVIRPTLNMEFRPTSSGASSINSTPRNRPSELEADPCPLITPISPTASPLASRNLLPSCSILQLDLHTQLLSSVAQGERDDSPIPGLLDIPETTSFLEVKEQESSMQSVERQGDSILDPSPFDTIRKEKQMQSPVCSIDGDAEEPPPTPLEKEEVAVMPGHGDERLSTSLFDGELSEQDETQDASSYSESSEAPPSPISFRFVIPTRTRPTRRAAAQQLPTPASLSPAPLSREAYWFAGPRPLIPVKGSTVILARIEEQEEVARQRSPAVIVGIISRLRREMKLTGGGSIGGQTQFLTPRPHGHTTRNIFVAEPYKNALRANALLACRARKDHDGRR